MLHPYGAAGIPSVPIFPTNQPPASPVRAMPDTFAAAAAYGSLASPGNSRMGFPLGSPGQSRMGWSHMGFGDMVAAAATAGNGTTGGAGAGTGGVPGSLGDPAGGPVANGFAVIGNDRGPVPSAVSAPGGRRRQAQMAVNSPEMKAALALCEKPWQELTVREAQTILEQVKILINHRRVRVVPKRAAVAAPQHTCIACGRSFKSNSVLQDHMNEHTGARPHACDEPGCNETFYNRNALSRHQKNEHGRIQHVCSEPGCGWVFLTATELRKHAVTHSEARPWKCTFPGCGKSFKTEETLKGHGRVHTKEKKFACEFPGCGKRFGYKVDLKRHMRTHYGQPAKPPTRAATSQAVPPAGQDGARLCLNIPTNMDQLF